MPTEAAADRAPDASSSEAPPETGSPPSGRCLMCNRWIDERRMVENPDEILCIDHRGELAPG